MKWQFAQPNPDGSPDIVTMTEGEILSYYWDYWSNAMRAQGKSGINPERCIEDWAVIHWAKKIEEKPM